jgi:hypothetical protein
MRKPFSISLAGALTLSLSVATGSSATPTPAAPATDRSEALFAVAPVGPHDVWVVGDVHLGITEHLLIRHWDGSHWHSLPVRGLPDSSDSFLLDVAAVSPDDVWAVGALQLGAQQGRYRSLILHYDGSSWQPVHHPNGHHYTALGSIAVVDKSDVWVGGTIAKYYGGPYRTLFEHWDGTEWSISLQRHPRRRTYGAEGMDAVSHDDVWAIAPYTFFHRGSRWRPVGAAQPGGEEDLDMISANDGWATDGAHNLVHWDGTAWTDVDGVPDARPMALAAIGPDDVWAGGALLEHWDGSQWSQTPALRGTVVGMGGLTTNDVWAVGLGSPRGIVEHWDGAQWSLLS